MSQSQWSLMVVLRYLPLMIHRRLLRLPRRWIVFNLALCSLWAIWAIGFVEYIRQQSYRQHFHWPALDNLGDTVSADRLKTQRTPALNKWSQLYRPLISPSCTSQHIPRDFDTNFVLVIVRTAPDRLERRSAIRASWALNGKFFGSWHFRTVFVLGSGTEALRAEAEEFGDLLVGNFVDHYENCTLKLVNALSWARHYCARPPTRSPSSAVPFLLLIDDDEILLPWNLAAHLSLLSPDRHLYEGNVQIDALPARLLFSKWMISIQDYPYDLYPPYVQGNAILLSRLTLSDFYTAIEFTKLFIWDDVWLGIIARYLGIHPTDSNSIFVREHEWSVPRWWDDWDNVRAENWTGVVAMHGFNAPQIRSIYRWLKTEKQKSKN